jgi:hypothetical protein
VKQFNPDDRAAAYEFVKRRLVYVSLQAVQGSFLLVVKIVRQNAVKDLGLAACADTIVASAGGRNPA